MAPRSGLSLILCFTIVAATLLLHATADHVTLPPADAAAGLTQQAYLRGNTNAPSSTKKAAVVTGEMHVGDPSLDAIFADYRDGTSPTSNCKRNCRRP